MDNKERAVKALTSPAEFCSLMAEAREFKFPGWWEGSAFRHHPVGVIDGTVKMTNEWTVWDSCSIEITDGDGWNRNVCQDSFAYSSPNPDPINGISILIWSNGRWKDDEIRARMEPRIVEILTRLVAHAETAREEREEQEARKQEAYAAVISQARETAIARATGEQP